MDTTIIYDDSTLDASDDETQVVLRSVFEDESLPRSAVFHVANTYYFKTPLNLVIAVRKPERDFVRHLTTSANATAIDAWIKSTDQDFYSIEYSWRKGEHPKRGNFNPDFFIRQGGHVWVIEIKDNSELHEPSDENRGKYRAAIQHFTTLNELQQDTVYHFHFLVPSDYDMFFNCLREKDFNFVSNLDVVLAEGK